MSRCLNVREDLHYRNLCAGCNTYELTGVVLALNVGKVVTCNNAGNVGSVVGEEREDVGVAVRIVEAEGNLIAYVNVLCGKTFLSGLGGHIVVCKDGRYLIKGKAKLVSVSGKVAVKECGVVVVKTGIKNRNYNTCAVISVLILECIAVENTGAVNVYAVLNKLCFAGIVLFANNNVCLTLKSLAYVGKVTCLDYHLKAGHNYVVALAESVVNTLEIFTKGGCLLSDILSYGLCLCCENVIGEGELTAGCVICIKQGGGFHLYDDRDIIAHLNGIGKLVHYRLVKEVFCSEINRSRDVAY